MWNLFRVEKVTACSSTLAWRGDFDLPVGRTSCRPPHKHLRGYNSGGGGVVIKPIRGPPVKYNPQNSEEGKWSRRVKRDAEALMWPSLTMVGGVDTLLSVAGSILTSTDPRGCREALQFLVLFKLFLQSCNNPGTGLCRWPQPPTPTPDGPLPLLWLLWLLSPQACAQNHVFLIATLSFPLSHDHRGNRASDKVKSKYGRSDKDCLFTLPINLHLFCYLFDVCSNKLEKSLHLKAFLWLNKWTSWGKVAVDLRQRVGLFLRAFWHEDTRIDGYLQHGNVYRALEQTSNKY